MSKFKYRSDLKVSLPCGDTDDILFPSLIQFLSCSLRLQNTEKNLPNPYTDLIQTKPRASHFSDHLKHQAQSILSTQSIYLQVDEEIGDNLQISFNFKTTFSNPLGHSPSYNHNFTQCMAHNRIAIKEQLPILILPKICRQSILAFQPTGLTEHK